MSKTTIFIPANHQLTVTADALASGHHYRVVSGSQGTDFTAIAVSTAPTIGPFSDPRTYAIVADKGVFTTAIVPYTVENAGISADGVATLTNKTFDANGTGNSISNIDVADLADGTDGNLITYDAAGAPEVVATGTSGQVLTSNGVGTAPTMQTPSGGGFVPIGAAQTASDSATIDFTGLSVTYQAYKVIFSNVVPAVDDRAILLEMDTDNGASFDQGSNYNHMVTGRSTAGSTTNVNGTGSSYIQLMSGGADNGASSGGINGELTILNPALAAVPVFITCQCSYPENDGTNFTMDVGGGSYIAASVDAIRFRFGSGNITSGEFQLLGLLA